VIRERAASRGRGGIREKGLSSSSVHPSRDEPYVVWTSVGKGHSGLDVASASPSMTRMRLIGGTSVIFASLDRRARCSARRRPNPRLRCRCHRLRRRPFLVSILTSFRARTDAGVLRIYLAQGSGTGSDAMGTRSAMSVRTPSTNSSRVAMWGHWVCGQDHFFRCRPERPLLTRDIRAGYDETQSRLRTSSAEESSGREQKTYKSETPSADFFCRPGHRSNRQASNRAYRWLSPQSEERKSREDSRGDQRRSHPMIDVLFTFGTSRSPPIRKCLLRESGREGSTGSVRPITI